MLFENDMRSDLEIFKKFLISACVLEQQFRSQTTKIVVLKQQFCCQNSKSEQRKQKFRALLHAHNAYYLMQYYFSLFLFALNKNGF